MIHIETDIAIAAPPEAVWATLTDFARYPEWNPFIVAASGPLVTGGQLAIRVRDPGGSGRILGLRPAITVCEPARKLAWKGVLLHRALFGGEHYFRLEPSGAHGTHFVHGEAFEGLALRLLGEARVRGFASAYHELNRALAQRVTGDRA